jgi:hypothetical protein
MDQESLVKESVDAGWRFLQEFNKAYHVEAAVWARPADTGQWCLYVVSPEITDENFDIAYAEVIRIAALLRDPHFDPFRVRLGRMDQDLAKFAIEMKRRYDTKSLIHFDSGVSGTVSGMSVSEVSIYPLPVTTPAS